MNQFQENILKRLQDHIFLNIISNMIYNFHNTAHKVEFFHLVILSLIHYICGYSINSIRIYLWCYSHRRKLCNFL